MSKALDNLGTRSALWLVIAIGVAIRVVTAATTKGHGFDLEILGNWGEKLRYHRTDEFYYVAKNPDHLPGDLWFHWLLSHVYQAFYNGPDYWTGGTYYFFLKLVPSLADVIIAVLLFSIIRTLASERTGLVVTALFFLNPATMFISSMWGQWDSVSMAFLVSGMAVIVMRPDRWLWAVPLIAWACVIKPPLALPGGLILALPLVLAFRDAPSIFAGLRRTVLPALIALVSGLATILLVCIPFSVGFPGMATNWTIFERANIALDMYPYKVLAAGNIWMLQIGSFDHIDDREPAFLGLNAHDLGNVYLGSATILIGLVFLYFVYGPLRDNPMLALTWSAAAITFATYVLPTRVHERYLFPAFVFIILLIGLTGLNRQVLTYLAVFSATFVANLAFVYFAFQKGFTDTYGADTFGYLLRLTSVLNIVAFILLMLFPLRWLRHSAGHRHPTSRTIRRFRDAPSL